MTVKAFSKESLLGTMRSLWNPRKGGIERPRILACALEGSDRFLFCFTCENDRRRVLTGCPWHFDKALLALSATDGRMDPGEVSLNVQFFWIRVRGLPPLLLEDSVGELISNIVWLYVRTDALVSGGGLGSYLRIRVGINIDKPLRRLATVRPPDQTVAWTLEVEYEKLPHFCYYYGLLSHTGSHCALRLSGAITEVQYDDLIRVEKKEFLLRE
ncbi:hypothetical protein M0R45_001191 [Rubus argutus]|uniref:DUF4283 domain-containing protein n=1 Tax=Rubus argutus TaxID=59490 RepID=A0AAW1VMD5_RUBAR